MLTIRELKEKIASRVDEVTLCDILEITSTDLVEVFQDKIEDKYDILVELVEGLDISSTEFMEPEDN